MINSILDKYHVEFGNPEIYIKSPGRANIIGEHTDYNKGLVMPFAIEQCIYMYLGSNQYGLLRIFAHDLNESIEVDITQINYQNKGWQRYFLNTLIAIEYKDSVGLDIVFGGNLPQGGGVSSSSAITCGFLAGLNLLFNYKFTADQMISLSSQAENGIGLNGGIMDQTAIIKGRKGHALKIDFNDFTLQEIAMPPKDYSFYLFNSGQSHNLVETEYNKRRSTCENALKTIQHSNPKIKSFRDVNIEDLSSYSLDVVATKRCTHVISENQRVEKTKQILEERKYGQLGKLLLESHESLAQNYEVSTSEIDYLVQRSQSINNILGSRIMGGGFGGCTINFVKGKLNENDIEILKKDYKLKTGLELKVFKINASNGIEVIKVNNEEV